jgi:hypothetical protein
LLGALWQPSFIFTGNGFFTAASAASPSCSAAAAAADVDRPEIDRKALRFIAVPAVSPHLQCAFTTSGIQFYSEFRHLTCTRGYNGHQAITGVASMRWS